MLSPFNQRRKNNREPLEFGIFKGIKGKYGAVRFRLKRPYTGDNDKYVEGCVFLNAAPPAKDGKYDWDNNRIDMGLTVGDVQSILLYLRSPKHPVFIKRDRNYKPIMDDNGFPQYDGLTIYHETFKGQAGKDKQVITLRILKKDDSLSFNFFVKKTINGTATDVHVPVTAAEVLGLGTLLQAAIPHMLAWETSALSDNNIIERLEKLEQKLAGLTAMIK